MKIEDTPTVRYATRGATAALYFATSAIYGDMYVTQALLPVLSLEFGIAAPTAGLTISAVVVMIAVASFAYGPLSDAWGRKPVMVWCCALLAIPTLLCTFASSFGSLLLFRALQGLLIPGVTAVSVAYIGDNFDSRAVGGIVGGLVSAAVAGGLIGRVASGLITDYIHWRAAFVFFAIYTLTGALAIAYTLPDRGVREVGGWAKAYRGMFLHLRDRRLVGAFIIGGTLFFSFLGTFTFLPYYLTAEPFNLSIGLVSSVYVVYLAGVIVAPLAGSLSAYVSRRTIIGAGLCVAIAGIAGTLAPSLLWIIVSLVVLCAGMWIAQSTVPTFVNATAAQAKGGAGALYLAFYYVGGTAGSVLPGYAWQGLGWPGVVVVCGLSLVIGLLANWLLCGGVSERQAHSRPP